MIDRKRVVAVLAVSALTSGAACAQAWPVKPVRLVVPFAPGGALDFTTRVVAQKLQESLGQQMVVDNRAGGGGMIGAEIVARAAPDGYTVLFASPAEITINQHLYRKVPYDPARDFVPVIHHVTTPLVLAVHPSLPARTLPEMVELARKRPGQLSYGSAGTGGVQHLAGELLRVTAKIDILHVPYKGAGPAVVDLVGGQIVMGFLGLPPAMPHVRAGRLRALAVTSAKRSPAAPEVPAFAESGFRDFNIVNWFGVLLPAGTPREIVTRLNAEVAKAIAAPDARERMLQQGAEPVGGTPEQFEAFIRAETARYAQLVKISGAKVD